jgi:hypothetical protein
MRTPEELIQEWEWRKQEQPTKYIHILFGWPFQPFAMGVITEEDKNPLRRFHQITSMGGIPFAWGVCSPPEKIEVGTRASYQILVFPQYERELWANAAMRLIARSLAAKYSKMGRLVSIDDPR